MFIVFCIAQTGGMLQVASCESQVASRLSLVACLWQFSIEIDFFWQLVAFRHSVFLATVQA